MYCKNCGKLLSDEAFMCPDCGTPTGVVKANAPVIDENITAPQSNVKAIAIVGFVFACIAFFCGLILGSLTLSSAYRIFIDNSLTILPALAAIGIGIYTLCMREGGAAKVFSIINVSLSGFTILFSFICILA